MASPVEGRSITSCADGSAARVCRKEEERLQRIQRAREYEDAAWVDAGATDEDSHDEELVLAQDELYCVACDKFFKSANALANHERCAANHVVILETFPNSQNVTGIGL